MLNFLFYLGSREKWAHSSALIAQKVFIWRKSWVRCEFRALHGGKCWTMSSSADWYLHQFQPDGICWNKSSHIFLIDILCIFLPTVVPSFPRDASLSLIYHQKRASILSAYFQISWVPLRVTYQILNHVLGCQPSPPILLIHPMPHCHCLQLRLRLKGAYPKRQSPGFVGVRLSPHEEWSFPRDPN